MNTSYQVAVIPLMSFEAGDRLGSASKVKHISIPSQRMHALSLYSVQISETLAVKSTVLGALADLAIEVGIVIVGPLCFRNPVSVLANSSTWITLSG